MRPKKMIIDRNARSKRAGSLTTFLEEERSLKIRIPDMDYQKIII
jgi:hypothetical protein